jgi:hypothetical protein
LAVRRGRWYVCVYRAIGYRVHGHRHCAQMVKSGTYKVTLQVTYLVYTHMAHTHTALTRSAAPARRRAS